MSDNDEIKDSWRVVVVGAGFWRVSAATGLAWPQFQVTPIDQHNFHLLEPLLYQVASGARQPCFDHDDWAAHCFVPARDVFHHRHHPITQGGHGESEQAAGASADARQVTLAGMSVNG